jgi:hypothetical protein
LLDRFPGNLLLVGHGASVQGVCRALVPGSVPGLPAPCCLIEVVRADGKWSVRRDENDLSHLSAATDRSR